MLIPYSKIKRSTRRLLIRAYREDDYEGWREAQINRLPQQNKFDKGRPPKDHLTRSAFKKRIKQFQARANRDELYVFGIFNKQTGQHVGVVDLFVIVRKDLHWANLGYSIHNNQWGQGYAKEAAKAAIQIGFKNLGLHRIEAAMELDHKVSQRVARRIGMRKEGIRRRFYPTTSGWEDMVVFVSVK